MELKTPSDEYILYLGRLEANLHSLETILRISLLEKGQNLDIENINVGDQLDKNAINKWAYLPELIEQYNKKVGQSYPEYILNKPTDIIILRNVLAHGIVIGITPDPPYWILKFGKQTQSKEKVSVEFVQLMTVDWIRNQIDQIYKAIQVVNKYLLVHTSENR